jgi:hypothetical protein
MHDSPPRIDPVLNLARNQMELVSAIHLTHLAIISGRDETRVLEFDETVRARMVETTIPSLIAEIEALSAILSSPARKNGRYGAVVTLIDRTLEAFYVPIVRIINMEPLIGDFRPTEIPDPLRFDRIFEELRANWVKRRYR